METINQLPPHIDKLKILIKNFPSDFTRNEIQQFVKLFSATDVRIIGRTSALAQFGTEQNAFEALKFLHQQTVKTNILTAEYAKRNNVGIAGTDLSVPQIRLPECNPMVSDIKIATAKITNFMQKLYAPDNGKYDLTQPPPPHLHYLYPKLNRDIMDSICIALETSEKFYTQVLHLMNRMNLEPPFVPGARNLKFPVIKCDAFSQTDVADDERKRPVDLASGESEMSDDCEPSNRNGDEMLTVKVKRKRHNDPEHSKKRMRSIIDAEKSKSILLANQTKINRQVVDSVNVAFNDSKPIADRMEKIKILAPPTIDPKVSTVEVHTMVNSVDNDTKEPAMAPISKEELQSNQIPFKQLSNHPLFQNYQPGDRSNKLYIKNLAKSVNEDDLKRIYQRYCKMDNQLDVKLMRTGRMKGQAFVTFNLPYLDDSNYAEVQQALDDTNGFILKDKVMVVVFGKNVIK